MAAGVRCLEQVMNATATGRRKNAVRCRCGTRMQSRGIRSKELLTLLGPVRFQRSLYQCPTCGTTRYPGDEALDIAQTSRSPGVRRQAARLGAKEPFREVARDLRELAGITLSRKDAERIAEAVGEDMERRDKVERDRLRHAEPPPPETPKTIETLYIEYDGTGVPMTKKEVAGRKGKQKDGSAKTREVKLGCVFTQTTLDDNGRPQRDPASTTFTGAIETASTFGWRIYAEARRRGLFEAKRVVVLGDGAEWIRNIAQTHFGNAIHIVDLYHAREHVTDLCRYLFGRDIKRLNRYRDRWWDDLDEGNIEKITREATQRLPKGKGAGKDARQQIGYFNKNKERMRYKEFRKQNLFVGSGVIEAGCRTIVAKRMKQSGMEWSVPGANAIIALQSAEASARTEDYWDKRAS